MKKCVFRKIDYNSGDGMLTSVWGPNLWHVLHMISFNYPINPTKEDKKNYMRFIKDLRYVLPCKYCRDNLNGNLRKLKFTMKSMKNRDTFSRFVYKLHNHVNKMLGKNNTVTFEEIRVFLLVNISSSFVLTFVRITTNGTTEVPEIRSYFLESFKPRCT